MGKFTENMIKKAISETIVEELLRDLGFFVLKLGQENTLNPLVQMKDFVTSCDGKFRLDYLRARAWVTRIEIIFRCFDE
jgi:hypothetical protein